jgi:hypothetical protein
MTEDIHESNDLTLEKGNTNGLKIINGEKNKVNVFNYLFPKCLLEY